MPDIYIQLNKLKSKYCNDVNKCNAASVVRINDKYIYSLDLLSTQDNTHRLITECYGIMYEYPIDFHLSSAAICSLPTLAVIISNLQMTSNNADKVILSGDSLLCSYLNYALKFNGTNFILCVGTNKDKLLHLVSNTDINLFFNASTQNEDDIIIENFNWNIIVDAGSDYQIIRNIPKKKIEIDNFNLSSNIIPSLAKWISERKINDETFFDSNASLFEYEELISAILITNS